MALDGIERERLVTKRRPARFEMLHVEVAISFEEMKKSKNKRYQTLTHPAMLRLEFLLLNFGGSEKDLFGCLGRNHRRQLRRDVKPMPYATEIVEAHVARIG